MAQLVILVTSFGFIGLLYYGYTVLIGRTCERMHPLLAIIEGRITSRITVNGFKAIIEGKWRGEPVRIEAVEHNSTPGSPASDLLITLFNPWNRRLSVRLWNRPKSIFDFMNLPTKAVLSRHRLKIPEANLLGTYDAENHDLAKTFLNPQRVEIIQDFISCGFNYFEIDANPLTRGHVNIRIEAGRSNRPTAWADESVLKPENMEDILEKLRKFETAVPQTQTKEQTPPGQPTKKDEDKSSQPSEEQEAVSASSDAPPKKCLKFDFMP